MSLLYVKATHLLFIISWMAGIFYLPRIFVHHVEGKAAGEDVRRLKIMARKLYHFTSAMAVLALASGLWLWLGFGFQGGWIHAKLTMVVLLIAYHISMRVLMKRMLRDAPLPVTVRELEGAPMVASGIHRGHMRDLGQLIKAMIIWVGSNGYTLAGPLRELHLTPRDPNALDKRVVEMQAPIAPQA